MGYKDLSVKIDDMINMIIVTLDARDPYTYSHSERVAALSVLIATKMGFDAENLEKIHIAAHLHDIGKIGVSDSVLNKEGKLTRDELIQMQSHSLIGYNILNKIAIFREIEVIVLHHHERYDGQGYPNNIKGESIPIESRIIAVADSFDAITSDRPYRLGVASRYLFQSPPAFISSEQRENTGRIPTSTARKTNRANTESRHFGQPGGDKKGRESARDSQPERRASERRDNQRLLTRSSEV